MLVSIIIPSYNHAAYLQDRIESILNQSYQNFELIILDDKSPDDSYKILDLYKNHPKVSYCIINTVNSGSTFAQWNKGIKLAKGELIWIAESDDIADSQFLELLVAKFLENTNLVLAYCQSYRMRADGVVTGDWKDHTDSLDSILFENSFVMNGLVYLADFLSDKNTIPNASAVLFRKQTYLAVGGAVESLTYLGDWDIWTKIISQGQLYFEPLRLNYFRYHDNSVIAQLKKNLDRKIIEVEKQVETYRNNTIALLMPYANNPVVLKIIKSYKTKLNRCYKKIIKHNLKAHNYLQAQAYINKLKKNVHRLTFLRLQLKWFFFKLIYSKKKS